FLRKNVHQIRDFLNPTAILALLQIGFFQKYWDHVSHYFKNPKIRAALSFQSIYVGAAPTRIPAAYALIQFVEATQGVWTIEGGLHQLAGALEKIGTQKGVKFHSGKGVKRILVRNTLAYGIELEDGTIHEADLILSNADLPRTYHALLPAGQSPLQRRKLKHSCSAFMMYLGIRRTLPIQAHTYLLPEEFLGALEDIFVKEKIPSDPGIYLHAPAKLHSENAPEGMEALLVLVPVPNTENKTDWKMFTPSFRQRVLEKINRVLKLNIQETDIVFEKIRTPADWENEFFLGHGSTFGLAPTLLQSAFFRPPNRDPKIKNLYFVGASTHPGSGIPIVLFSAQNVVRRIQEEYPEKKGGTAEHV
ncbi:MAG: phytoene desaturase, partial [Candidatus Diapherotrites archaeon]|nr:phytoene desaturase [Candidatus Diapherotrites archaeon]